MSSGDSSATLGVGEQLKVLEGIIQTLIFRDLVTPPQQCNKAEEIKAHFEQLEKFYRLSKISSEENKVSILFNTITEDMRLEICCQVDFEAHENDYEWIKRKLIELFHPKESEITSLVKLYSIKQKPHQSLREFLSEIRIEGYKLLKGIDAEEREKRLVDAFSKGLRSDEIRAALNTHVVDSLDDAYRLIKKEKCTTDECYTRQINSGNDNEALNEIQNLRKEMTIIQKQLQSIVTILQGVKSLQPTYADAVRERRHEIAPGKDQPRRQIFTRKQEEPKRLSSNARELRRNDFRCWTCGDGGHIARFCVMNCCKNCGRRGHASWQCRASRRTLNVRQLQEDQWDSEGELHYNEHDQDSSTSSPNLCSTPGSEPGEDEIPQIRVLTVEETNQHHEDYPQIKTIRGHRRRKPTRERPSYPQYILDLNEYIHGKRSKKNVRFEEADTLITKQHSERAKNKPIVQGLCHGKPTKIFLDTGAEINVIDKGLVKQLSDRKVLKINRASKVIRCANNSRLNVEGWVRMSVTLGNQQKECKFWVIDKLFPRIIMGIRAMKDFSVSVDPANDCVWVGGKSVPFLSNIQSQSLYGQVSGNGKVPGWGVDTRWA
jgi:hypothetical protein